MRKKLTNQLLLACSIFASEAFQPVQSTESTPIEETQKPGMQLAKGIDDTLEAPLGTGANVLLKISLDLKELKRWTKSGRLEVPAKVFLTDFSSSPLNERAFNFQVGIDCDLTPLNSVFPDKPKSFDSYDQFAHWLEQGYFTNQVRFTYDFHLDIQTSAPSLAKQVYFTAPGGYHFAGTYAIDNPKIIPDSCIPKISYSSERGDINATTITLGGELYLDKKGYPVPNHSQILPHKTIEEKIIKEEAKLSYNYKWLSKRQAISKLTYEELSNDQIKNWPDLKAATYSILRRVMNEREDIWQLSCTDGSSGQEINIAASRVFLIEGEIGKVGDVIESAITDSQGNLYIVKYKNLSEVSKKLMLDHAILNWDHQIKKHNNLKKKAILADNNPNNPYFNDYFNVYDNEVDDNYIYRMELVKRDLKNDREYLKNYANYILDLFKTFEKTIGIQHPNWEEFSQQLQEINRESDS